MNKCLSLVHLTGRWVAKPHFSDWMLYQSDVLLVSGHLFRGIAERFAPADLTDNRLPLCLQLPPGDHPRNGTVCDPKSTRRGARVARHGDVPQLHPPNSYRGNNC